MPAPLLAAAPYVLQGLSALGGVFGRKKKKYLDEESLRRLYGPNAVARDTSELSQYILNSPYGQQLLTSAAEQGQTLQNEMASRAAASGLDASSGGQSGAGDFATSAAVGAQTGLERGVRSQVTQAAMPIAAEGVGSRMQAALMQQGQQNADSVNTLGRLGSAAGQVAASLPANAPQAAAAPQSLAQYAQAQGNLPMQSLVNAANQPTEMPERRMQGALTNSRSGSVRRGLVRR